MRVSSGRAGWRAIGVGAAWVAFPLCVWLLATYALGDIGKWVDDYTQVVRDHETGRIVFPWWPWMPNPNFEGVEPFFYRPLRGLYSFNMHTALNGYGWARHLLAAIGYGLSMVAFWRVARLLLVGGVSAMGATLAFMLFPTNVEVALWTSATPTAFAMASFLVLVELYVRRVRGELGACSLAWMGLLAFSIPCWNEQPAAGVVALPLLALGVGEPVFRSRRALVRAAVPVVIAGACVGLYVVILKSSIPAWHRAGADRAADAEEIVRGLPHLAGGVVEMLTTRNADLLLGGIERAMGVMRSVGGIAALVVAAALGALWVIVAAALPGETGGAREGERPLMAAGLFGVGLFVASWLPLAAVEGHAVYARTAYPGAGGLALVLGMVIEVVMRRVGSGASGRTERTAMCAGIVGASLAGAMAFIGAQANFKTRYEMDLDEAAQLVGAIPDPAPNAVFMPLRIDNLPSNTGRAFFDHFVLGAFSYDWTSQRLMQEAYGRTDVYGTQVHPMSAGPLRDLERETVRYRREKIEPPFEYDARGGMRLRWDDVVPFYIGMHDRVNIVRRLWVERADHRDFLVTFPIVEDAVRHGLKDWTTFVMDDRADGDAGEPIEGWRDGVTGDGVHPAGLTRWQMHRPTIVLGGAAHDAPSSIVARLGPSEWATELRFRATLPVRAIRGEEGPVRIEWLIDGEKVSSVTLEPGEVARERRWMPVIIDVPAHGEAVELRVALIGDEDDSAWITPGHVARE